MIQVDFKIATQKKGSYDCGSIAVINVFRFFQEKHIPNLKSLQKKLNKQKTGVLVSSISTFLNSKDIKYNILHEPNIKQIIPRIQNGGAIILFNTRQTTNHYSMILKITKKYVYLTNMFNDETDTFDPIKKIKLDHFLKFNFLTIIYF